MKRNVSVVKLCLYVSECVCSKIIKELPGLVGSGTFCIYAQRDGNNQIHIQVIILKFPDFHGSPAVTVLPLHFCAIHRVSTLPVHL